MSVLVSDPFGAAADPAMPSLRSALDPPLVERGLARCLPRLARDGTPRLRAIRVVRHKPGRRCIVEYDLEVEGHQSITLMGKVRRGRFGKSGHRLLEALWNAGFQSDSPDGISVPEPFGTISAFRMWLQRKVRGRVASDLLPGSDGLAVARRIAEAAHKVHSAGVPADRRHRMRDELDILRRCLGTVALANPAWEPRIERLVRACDRLGAAVPERAVKGIHRDFYADQVLVDGSRLHLVDFDLYCEGDPGLDVGNFLGHVTEQSLRGFGDPEALASVERAMEERFIDLTGEGVRPAVAAYTTLTLARHVYLSSNVPGRRKTTKALLELCEERLALGRRGRPAPPPLPGRPG